MYVECMLFNGGPVHAAMGALPIPLDHAYPHDAMSICLVTELYCWPQPSQGSIQAPDLGGENGYVSVFLKDFWVEAMPPDPKLFLHNIHNLVYGPHSQGIIASLLLFMVIV